MQSAGRTQGRLVVDELRRRIVLNVLQPGTVLTEMTLAAEMDSSQGAVREALLRLEGEGLVMRSGHRGTTVTNLGAAEAAEMLWLRRQIECRAATGAASNLSSGDLQRLAELLTEMLAAAESESLWDVVEADRAFHMTLFRAAGLPAVEPVLTRCILHTHRFKLWAPWHQRPLRDTAERHRPLLDAAAARDGRALRAGLRLHLDTIVEKAEAA